MPTRALPAMSAISCDRFRARPSAMISAVIDARVYPNAPRPSFVQAGIGRARCSAGSGVEPALHNRARRYENTKHATANIAMIMVLIEMLTSPTRRRHRVLDSFEEIGREIPTETLAPDDGSTRDRAWPPLRQHRFSTIFEAAR